MVEQEVVGQMRTLAEAGFEVRKSYPLRRSADSKHAPRPPPPKAVEADLAPFAWGDAVRELRLRTVSFDPESLPP